MPCEFLGLAEGRIVWFGIRECASLPEDTALKFPAWPYYDRQSFLDSNSFGISTRLTGLG
jgi:hypothetical protein